MWRFRLSALYCVRTKTRRRSELMQLESVMSMMRYSPPNGTAGLARSRVSGHNRSPCPPASSTPMASRIADMADPPGFAFVERAHLTTECKKETNAKVPASPYRGSVPELLRKHYDTVTLRKLFTPLRPTPATGS